MPITANGSDPVVSSWRHPAGTPRYFDPAYAETLIRRYNESLGSDISALDALLVHVEPLAKSILEYRASTKFEDLDELLSRVRLKLWRTVRLFDPARGSAFSFCARVINSAAMSAVGEAWARADRYTEITEAAGSTIPADIASREVIADIDHRIRRARSSCVDPFERRAQRWFVESFIDAGFVLKRHEAADSVMKVFGISHPRSRQLHDLTVLEVRRQLIGEKWLPLITPDLLKGTKLEALMRYAYFLGAADFSKLAVLMRDLAPSLVLAMRPENICGIRRGDPEASRANLRLVLDGEPNARPLFAQ
jgi:hypothetical protein